MLILDQCSAVSCQTTFLQIWEHVEEVNGCDELDNGVTQELETLVVTNFRLCFVRLAEAGHDAKEKYLVIISYTIFDTIVAYCYYIFLSYKQW